MIGSGCRDWRVARRGRNGCRQAKQERQRDVGRGWPLLAAGHRCTRRHLAGSATLSPQPPHLFQDLVERLAGDELHHVVMHAALVAHTEDRHDVGVVQPGRRPGLTLEAPDLLRGRRRARSIPSERRGGRATLAQPHRLRPCHPGRLPGGCGSRPAARGTSRLRSIRGPVGSSPDSAGVFHVEQDGEQLLDLVDEVGIPSDVFADRRPLAAPLARQEVVSQDLDRIAITCSSRTSSSPSRLTRLWLARPAHGEGRDRREDLFHSLECPDVAVAGGRF